MIESVPCDLHQEHPPSVEPPVKLEQDSGEVSELSWSSVLLSLIPALCVAAYAALQQSVLHLV